jgi:hypothetical protein
MSYLNRMYGKNSLQSTAKTVDKNPARVSGGLRGHGQDHLVMVSENGLETQIPTQRYVQSLEEQIRKQRAFLNVLERKVARCDAAIEQLKNSISRSRV